MVIQPFPGSKFLVSDIYTSLKGVETQIDLELQKLILKRTFRGRCDICPD